MEKEDVFSSESDLLDGEHWSDEDIRPKKAKVVVETPVLKAPTKKLAASMETPNYAGVRKYIAQIIGSLQLEYPDSTDKELRAMATRRWHDLTEPERKEWRSKLK